MKRVVVGLLVLGAFAPVVRADSLYAPRADSLFADNKARRAGDILTILVSEQTQAVAQASTRAAKSEDAKFGPGLGPLLGQIRKFGLSGGTKLDASGQTARNGSLNGRITVTVKGVDTSGNLLLEGVREVMINAEKQRMVITGRVRPADVQPDNTVLSSFVADAAIRYEGKGIVGDKQREGVITKIFKILF